MALRISAWLSLLLGVYAVAAFATLLGAAAGAAAGILGLLLGGAALTEHPTGRLRRITRIAVALNAIPVVGFAAILVVLADWPW